MLREHGAIFMGQNLDLMKDYPRIQNRQHQREKISERDRAIARKFAKDYFDGDRKHGYGGFFYNEKYWKKTVINFINHYQLKPNSKILDVGCAKGFMLKDFKNTMPDLFVVGVDISSYAIRTAHPAIKHFLIKANAINLPFQNDYFDLVISINTIHNLDKQKCIKALMEIERVSKRNAFVMVDGWKTDQEKENLKNWVLTAKTMLSEKEWLKLFKTAGYNGDYAFWKV